MIIKTDKYNFTPKKHFIESYNQTVDKIVFSGTFDTTKEELTLYNYDLTELKSYLGNKLVTGYTYSQISLLKNNNQLIEGYYYELKRRHKQSFGNPYNLPDYISSNVETFLLEASSVNTFNNKIISKIYPNDLIFYDFNNDVIKYRKDLVNNIECNFDFREFVIPQQNLNLSNLYLWEENISVNNVNSLYTTNDYVLFNTYTHLSTTTPNNVLLKDFSLLKDCKISYKNIGFNISNNIDSNIWSLYPTFTNINLVKNVKLFNESGNTVCFIDNGNINNIEIFNSNNLTFINVTGNNVTIQNCSKGVLFDDLSGSTFYNVNYLISKDTINTLLSNSDNIFFNNSVNNILANNNYVFLGYNSKNNKVNNSNYVYLNDNNEDNIINNGGYILAHNNIINNIFNNNFLYQNSRIILGGNIRNNVFDTLITNSTLNIEDEITYQTYNGYINDNNIKSFDLGTPFFSAIQTIRSMSGSTILNTSVVASIDTKIHDCYITGNNRILLNNDQIYEKITINGTFTGTGYLTLTSSTVNNNYYFLKPSNLTNPIPPYSLNVTTGGTYNGITSILS